MITVNFDFLSFAGDVCALVQKHSLADDVVWGVLQLRFRIHQNWNRAVFCVGTFAKYRKWVCISTLICSACQPLEWKSHDSTQKLQPVCWISFLHSRTINQQAYLLTLENDKSSVLSDFQVTFEWYCMFVSPHSSVAQLMLWSPYKQGRIAARQKPCPVVWG